MKKKVIYAIVALHIESENELTEDQIEEIGNEMDYRFHYEENGMQIVETEIKDVVTTYPK